MFGRAGMAPPGLIPMRARRRGFCTGGSGFRAGLGDLKDQQCAKTALHGRDAD